MYQEQQQQAQPRCREGGKEVQWTLDYLDLDYPAP